MLEVIKIDSLKLRVPKHKVTYVDSTFDTEYQKIYETGEIDDVILHDRHKVNLTNGISSRIAVFHSREGGIGQEQIVIQCNAKQLKEKYFEGITISTVKLLYKYIIDLQIIYLKYSDFLNAYVSDIDFCYDVNVTPISMVEGNKAIHKNLKDDCYKYVSAPFSRIAANNVGINFNTREKATPARPHVKIYHKTLELENKSFDFAAAYLKDVNYDNIGRLEFTLKNSKHKKHLNLQFKSFIELLNIKQHILEPIVFGGILNYVVQRTILREFQDLSPTQRMILFFIDKCIELGLDEQAIFNVLQIYNKPQDRSRMKKILKKLTEQVENKTRMLANQETMNFLRILRLDF